MWRSRSTERGAESSLVTSPRPITTTSSNRPRILVLTWIKYLFGDLEHFTVNVVVTPSIHYHSFTYLVAQFLRKRAVPMRRHHPSAREEDACCFCCSCCRQRRTTKETTTRTAHRCEHGSFLGPSVFCGVCLKWVSSEPKTMGKMKAATEQ